MSFEPNNQPSVEPEAVVGPVPAAGAADQPIARPASGYLPQGSGPTRTVKPMRPELRKVLDKILLGAEAEKGLLKPTNGSGPAPLPDSGTIQQREEIPSSGLPMPKQTSAIGAGHGVSNGVVVGVVNGANQTITRPGISGASLRAAQIRLVDEGEAESLIGYRVRGIAIPYFAADGSPKMGRDGKPFYRIRVAEPRDAKYLSPRDSGCQLYIPPGLWAILQPGAALSIVEGEFKAISLVEAGFPAVGIGGISSAAPRNQYDEPELIPDLAALIHEVRPLRIAFVGDSDTALIPAFAKEAVKLATLVGAPVVLPRIPINAPGKGPDDLREHWGAEFTARWQAILDDAESVAIGTRPGQLAVRLLRREASALAAMDVEANDEARRRLVQLAEAFRHDALALADIEQIAAESAQLSRPTLRAAVRGLSANRTGATSQAAAPSTGTQMIVLPGGDRSITAAAEEIFAAIGPTHTLFHRGGRVHEIDVNPDGTRRLRPITPVQFRSRLESYGNVFVWRSGADGQDVLKPTNCPEETSHALLESLPARDRLPNIAILSACPVLAKIDGQPAVLGPGWNPTRGGLFVTGGDVPPPTSIEEAVLALNDALSDFDFPTPGDKSRALASFISPGLRFGGWLTHHLPVDFGEADASQSGKTYRQKLVAALYREVPNVVVQRAGGVGGLDESISQKLVDGRPFVLLDNLRGRLDSPYLESVLTAPGPMPARVPHRGEVQVDPRGFIFQITSNGAETTRDLGNRVSITRIRKRPESYEFKSHKEGDIFAHIVANQPLYLGYVFAVIYEWFTKGMLRTAETRHDFREWAQTLDWIVQNIFGAAPLLDQHDEARQRVSDPRRVWLRSICIAMRDGNQTGEFLASQLADFALEQDNPPPNVREDADEDAVARAIGKIMAGAITDTNVMEIDGFRIHRRPHYSDTAKKHIPIYRFEYP